MPEKIIEFLKQALALDDAQLRKKIEQLAQVTDWNDPSTWGQEVTGAETPKDLPAQKEDPAATTNDGADTGDGEDTGDGADAGDGADPAASAAGADNATAEDDFTELEAALLNTLDRVLAKRRTKNAAKSKPAGVDLEEIAKSVWINKFGFDGPAILKAAPRNPEMGTRVREEDGKVKGYLVVFSGPTERDTDAEYFDKATEDLTAIFDEMGAVPAIYNHAMDTRFKSVVVGAIDTMEVDEDGLWVEAQIRQHDAYKRFLQPLVKQDVLYWSSGVLPRGKRASKGHILRWPIVEGSMTPTPAFFRGLWDDQQIKAMYSAAGLSHAALDSYNPDRELAIELERVKLLALS